MRTNLFIILFASYLNLFAQPSISFTFDDGSTGNRGAYPFEIWNQMLLDHLDNANLKAVFFVKGGGITGPKGKQLLTSWNARGHQIANHTFSHPNFNGKHSAADFKNELLTTDSLLRGYSNFIQLFRFPYLKEGSTKAKVDSIRQILKEEGYRHGHVTIDASDWYIDSRLRERLKERPDADLKAFKEFYLQHLFERATYYEKLALELTGRHIPHTLLLHHNLAAALFLGDAIKMFKTKGWQVISADEAYKDSIFKEVTEHAGESLIWAMAKDSGNYEGELRYPAEDSRYERKVMNALGL